jgi:RimJ/RimL family protein N-acetyltransferase
MDRIDAGVAVENIASKRDLEKIDMRYVGLAPERGVSFTITVEEYFRGSGVE